VAVKVVTDSVSDISPELATRFGITVVPLNLVFGNVTYLDGLDMTTDEFYERLAKEEALPTTSTPSPHAFARAYDELADGADGLLVITIGRKLSATGDAALKGRELMGKTCPVRVVMSENAMMGEGLLAIAAAKAASDGASLDELAALTERNMERVELRIAFDTLDYLQRGGRIGRAQALFGSLLGINPVLGIKDGEVFPFKRERSRAKALDYLCDFVSGFKSIEEVAVEDATTPKDAEAVVAWLSAVCDRDRIYRTKVSPVIGTNVGPRAVGVSVLGDRYKT
jgi:DegV family protein with EDD domain